MSRQSAIAAVLFVLLGSLLQTAGAEDKPLDARVKKRLETVNGHIDKTVKAVKDKNAAGARRSLDSAQKEWDGLLKDYAGKFDEDHPEISRTRDCLGSMRRELEKTLREWVKETNRLLDDVFKALESGDPEAAKSGLETARRPWKDVMAWFNRKLPEDDAEITGTRDRAGKAEEQVSALVAAAGEAAKIATRLEYGEHALSEGDKEKAARYVTEVEQSLESLLEKHKAAVGPRHPLVNGLVQSLNKLRQGIAGAEASGSWETKLSVFALRTGGGENKYLASLEPSMKLEEVRALAGFYREAKALQAEYGKASFETGKSEELTRIEKLFVERIEEFPKSASVFVSELGKLELPLREFEEKGARILEAADKDKAALPDPLSFYARRDELEGALDRLEKILAETKEFVGDQVSKAAEIRGRIEKLKALEKQVVEIRAQRTSLDAAVYAGSDADQLKKLAEETATKAFPGKAIRVSLTKPGWKARVEFENGAWVDFQEMWAQVCVDPSDTPIRKFGYTFDSNWVLRATVYVRKAADGSLKAHTTEYADLLSRANATK